MLKARHCGTPQSGLSQPRDRRRERASVRPPPCQDPAHHQSRRAHFWRGLTLAAMTDRRLPEHQQPGHADHMTSAGEQLMIRPSAVGAVVMTAWILCLCLLMVIPAISQHDPRGLLLVLIWLPWLVPVALLGRYRLRAAGDVLTYRSPLRTRSWRRDQIAEFGIVQSSMNPRIGYLYMRTRDGVQITFRVASSYRRRQKRLQAWPAALSEPVAAETGAFFIALFRHSC